MSKTSELTQGLKKGITGIYSGTIGGIVFQKNGVIRKQRNLPKRKPKG